MATTSQEDLGRLILIEHLPEPSVSVDNGEVSPVMSEPSWMNPIWDYLVDGKLPSDPKEASKLRAKLTRFTVHRGTLYKRGFYGPILKCLGKEDTVTPPTRHPMWMSSGGATLRDCDSLTFYFSSFRADTCIHMHNFCNKKNSFYIYIKVYIPP